LRAVETLIVVLTMLLLVTTASGWAYTYSMNQSKAGEITYAINVMLQLAEGVDGIVNHRGGSSTLQFEFRYGALVSADEQQFSLSTVISGVSYNLPPTGSPVYKTRRLHYFIPFSMYPSIPILDRGTENKTSEPYIVSSIQTDEPNLVFHYSSIGRTYVAYYRQPLVSIVRTSGKVSIHVTFLTFRQVALKAGTAAFVLESDDISSFYMPLASATPTVSVVLRGANEIQVNVGNQLPPGDFLGQGDILEVYAHQLTVAVR